MESWVLEGDSYSFLCSSANNYNLQHLDGPNHVEIFDITAVPTSHNVISETTCLCDIFGDDCESPILSSSPTSASILKDDVSEQLLVDVNDSSGSYHTAHDSDHTSDGSDIFDDSKDTVQTESSESSLPPSKLILPFEKTEGTLVDVSDAPINVNESDQTEIRNLQEHCLSQDSCSMQVENTYVFGQEPATPVSEITSVTFPTTPNKLHFGELQQAGNDQEYELHQNATGYFHQHLSSTSDITSDNDTVSSVKLINNDISLTKDHIRSHSCLDDCPVEKEKICLSDQQLQTSVSEFRDTNIRATDSTLDIITPESLSEENSNADETSTASSEIKEHVSLDTITTNHLPESSSTLKDSSLPIKDSEVIFSNGSPAPTYIDNRHLSPQAENQQAAHLSQDSCHVLVKNTYACNSSLTLDSVLQEEREQESQLPQDGIKEQTENTDVLDQLLFESTSGMTSGNGTVIKVNDNALLQTEDQQDPYWSQDNCPVEIKNPENRATTLTQIIIPDFLTENKGFLAEHINSTLPELKEIDTEETLTKNLLQENKGISLQNDHVHTESRKTNSTEETTNPNCLAEKRDNEQSNINMSELNETHSMQEDSHEPTALYEKLDFNQRIIPPNTLVKESDNAEQDNAGLSEQLENYPEQGASAPLTEHNYYILPKPEEMDLIQQIVQCEHQCSDNKKHTIISNSVVKLFDTPVEKNLPKFLPEEEMANNDCLVNMTNVSPEDSTCLQTCIASPDVTCKDMSSVLVNKDKPSKLELIDAFVSSSAEPLTDSKDDAKSDFKVINTTSTLLPELTEESTKLNVSLLPSDFTSNAETNEEHNILSPISNVTGELISSEIDEFCPFGGSLITAPSTEPSIIIHSPVGFTIIPSPEEKKMLNSAEPETDAQETATTDLNPHDSKQCLTPEFSSMNSVSENKQNVFADESVVLPEMEVDTCFLETCDVQSQNSHQKAILPRGASSQNKPQVQSQEVDAIETPEGSTLTGLFSNGFNNRTSLPISTISRPSSSSNIPRETSSPDTDVERCAEKSTLTTHSTNEITDLVMSPISNPLSTQDETSIPTLNSSSPLDIMYADAEGTAYNESSTSTKLYKNEITNRSLSFTPISLSKEDISRPPSTLGLSRDIVVSEVEVISINAINGNLPNLPSLQSSVDERENIEYSSNSIDKISPTTFGNCIPGLEDTEPYNNAQRKTDCQLLTTVSKEVNLPLSAQEYGNQFENAIYKEQYKSRPALDGFTDIAVKMSPIQKSNDLLVEPYCTEGSIIQIDQNQESMNDSTSHVMSHQNANSAKPWKASKTKITVPTTKKENVDLETRGTEGRTEILKSQSACSEREICQRVMRPGKRPNFLHSNNDSKYEGQSSSNKGRSRNWMRQEFTSLKGVENIQSSYRGEQVELSLSARNRNGLANHSPAPSSRDPKSEIPVCYFESSLATQQQQTLMTAKSLQEERKSGARSVKRASQSNCSGTGNLSSEFISETFSMGSEFDETDSEVKWFTDQAYSSLSSSQGDYLDIYNSSHDSSTNISQQSTMDSPSASTWISCADLYDTTLHSNNNHLPNSNSFSLHDTVDSKCFEMDSFECVDIAVESKEEARRQKRTVPKRQIQLKRLDFNKLKSAEDAENVLELPFTQDSSRASTVYQQSTASSVQEDLHKTGLDKTSTKTKSATTIIKSVLSKKMDSSTKESTKDECLTPDDNQKRNEIISAEEPVKQSLSPVIQSERSLLSEDNGGKEGNSPYCQKKTYRPKVPPKPLFRVGSRTFPPNSKFPGKIEVESKTKPIQNDPFERKTPRKQVFENGKNKTNDMLETYSSDSACGIDKYSSPSDTRAASMQRRITNRDIKQPVTPETHKQPDLSRTFLSKTSEINLKPCTVNDKDNNSSNKSSLSSDMKIYKASKCEPKQDERPEEKMQTSMEVESKEDSDRPIKPKSVLHKVRDVRKLVKNTYNLSFTTSNQHEENLFDKEVQPHPQRLHIECKAISWKDKQNSCRKTANILDETTTKVLKTDSEMNKILWQDNRSVQTSKKQKYVSEPFSNVCEQDTKLEIPHRSSSKEVTPLVYVKKDTPKGLQKTVSSNHSVSMLLKEKGMQADIGVCDVLNEREYDKTKHVNKIEVPLQTYGSEVATHDSEKLKKEVPCEQKICCDRNQPNSEGAVVDSSLKSKEKEIYSQTENEQNQAALLQTSKEQANLAVNAISTTKNPAPLRAVNKAEVRTFSSTTKSHAMSMTTSKEIELPIQVRSITSDRPKPSVLPKPNFKQPFSESRYISNDLPETIIKPATSVSKQQTHLNIDKIKMSTSLLHGNQSSEAAKPIPSNTKILAVSAVSSQKPEAISSVLSSLQTSATTSTSRQEVSITSVQLQQNMNNIKDQARPAESSPPSHRVLPAESQARSKLLHTKDFNLPASDDPPSYDERESFSPLLLSDLPAQRLNRYHPTTRHSLCSCASCSHPNYVQPYHGLQNQTPPTTHSPGQTVLYPGALPQAQVRPHQSKPDGHGLNCTSISPTITAPQAPAMIQPLQRSHTYQAPAIHLFSNDQQQPSSQQMDKRSGCQRSPQLQSGPPYGEHSHSPNIAALDSRSQFFNSQEMPPAFGHDFGSEGPGNSGLVYPESGLGYSQGSRRVLLDPETGKYFYIEVPMQPLRKMLFDPEIGQYVEVVIPQQSMSHSGMFPPAAAPYPSIGGPGLYTSQYLPYAVPPHPQSAQQPRHPEHSVPTSLQQTSIGYGNSAGHKRKSDVKGHPSLDQSYLESMYYIAPDMNANTNSTSSDCYHKPSLNMPTGGRRV